MTPFSYRTLLDRRRSPSTGTMRRPTSSRPRTTTKSGPGFLATIGIPLVAGREFTRADNETAPPVAVVDETMAAQFWRGGDPVGRRVQVKGQWMQVVGVARTAKYRNLLETPQTLFLCAAAAEFLGGRRRCRFARRRAAARGAGAGARDPCARRQRRAGASSSRCASRWIARRRRSGSRSRSSSCSAASRWCSRRSDSTA